jgi:alanine racemase
VRNAWVQVDRGAIAHNVAALRARVAPAALCAVVKADGYGHGAPTVAGVALDAGAELLGVALVEEGGRLRQAGISAPILVLSEPPLDEMDVVVAHGLTPTVYTPAGLRAAEHAAAEAGTVLGVHLKVDTGMHRVGAAPDDAPVLAQRIVDSPHLSLEGVFTHFAVADDPDDPFTTEQNRRFAQVLDVLKAAQIDCGRVHAANSAAAILHPDTRHDLVRCGIALYGLVPSPQVGNPLGLRPALSLHAKVSHVKRVAAGEALSYGLRYRLGADSQIATVPLGYADGVRRSLSERGGEVLIRGRRRPIAGTVTMDQILIDCGPDGDVEIDDEVVLLGVQGDDAILAEEWAERLDTITYEIVCGFGARLPRTYR